LQRPRRTKKHARDDREQKDQSRNGARQEHTLIFAIWTAKSRVWHHR
jgi:hypothetical protein